MPHFILDCSDDLFYSHEKQQVMQAVFDIAEESGLFRFEDIKIRVRPYSEYIVGGSDLSFLHVFAYIMEGRTVSQKDALSRSIVTALTKLFPTVPVVSMNVMEFEKASYNNRESIRSDR